MTVWYEAIQNEIYFIFKKDGKLCAEKGSYVWEGIIIPNVLGLLYWKVNEKNWIKSIERGNLIKLGKL